MEGTKELTKEEEGDGQLGDRKRITNDLFDSSNHSGQALGIENGCGEAEVDVPSLDDGEIMFDHAICLACRVLGSNPLDEEGFRGRKGVSVMRGGKG